MQRDERRLVLMQVDPEPLPDHPAAVLSQMVLGRIIAHDRFFERIRELDAVLLALDREADMVGERDEQRLIERLRQHFLKVPDHLLGQLQVLDRDLLDQFAQLALFALLLHAVNALNAGRVDGLSAVTPEADAPSGHDQLVSAFVHGRKDIIVDDLLDSHTPASP